MSDGSDEWYRDWFGEEYVALYPHRDEVEAERAVGLFRRTAGPDAPGRVLDLACGDGRHLDPLRTAGFRAVGLDLSHLLLRRARRRGRFPVVRADMRVLPFRNGTFDAVVSFFTSFGYFATEREDAEVLRGMRRVLRSGGSFLLDFLNAGRVRRELVPEDVRMLRGREVRQLRRIEEDRVVKRIEITEPGGGDPDVYHERVRLYDPGELSSMLEEAGLRPLARHGDYDGSDFEEDSPRLIIVGGTA